MKNWFAGIGLVIIFSWNLLAQDLSGLSICVDPGHGKGNTNAGPTGLREADINLSVSLFLKEFLKSAHIDTVLLTRVDDSTNPTLSQREAMANNFGVDWFHSVHHNAFNGSSRFTLVLLEEKRSFSNPCPDGSARGTGQPDWPGQADIMSNKMADWVFQALRTEFPIVRLDWTFFGGCNGGFSLGVLNDLLMPGELSEATFFDNPVEENKLRNPDFLKLEARALFMAILDFYDAGKLKTGALAGIIKSAENGRPVNGASVLLNPGNKIYQTDNNNNGLYVFHDLPPGSYQLQVQAPGFETQSGTVIVKAHDFSFRDFSLSVNSAPQVVLTLPGDQTRDYSVYKEIGVRFNRPMDKASVESAFFIKPFVSGVFTWNRTGDAVIFEPKTRYDFSTTYQVDIAGTAKDLQGRPLDGNGDGNGGDDFVYSFTTEKLDSLRPVILDFFPARKDTGIFLRDVFYITFSRTLDPATVNTGTILLNEQGGDLIEYRVIPAGNSLQKIVLAPQEPLSAGKTYLLQVTNSIKSVQQEPLFRPLRWSFQSQSSFVSLAVLDSFEAELKWRDPLNVSETHGVLPDSIIFRLSDEHPLFGEQAAELLYLFTEANGLISLEPSLSPVFEREKTIGLGIYVYGDSSLNKIRIALQDNDGIENLPWQVLDWVGWRLLRFDYSNIAIEPGTGGNGQLDGREIALHSVQMKFSGQAKGKIFLDDLMLIQTPGPTGILSEFEESPPQDFILMQNYPNPFNPETVINYRLNFSGHVTLSIFNATGQLVKKLVDTFQEPGAHQITWNGKDDHGHLVSSGIYIYQLKFNQKIENKKMIFLR